MLNNDQHTKVYLLVIGAVPINVYYFRLLWRTVDQTTNSVYHKAQLHKWKNIITEHDDLKYKSSSIRLFPKIFSN